MSEVDISEELPNGDDSAFTDDQHQVSVSDPNHDEQVTATTAIAHAHHAITADGVPVFVATSQGLLTAEQFSQDPSIKTTHIVIHDQTLDSGLKTPTTPIPPPTPATPLSKEKGFRYQWDESVHSPVLPVRCKNTNGEIHKHKFGSGGRGRCIVSGAAWYTPNEFEGISGRASSKDWKRSIRYGGRTLQCLIEDGILQPHATSCTCAACCDDVSVTGPIRLFVPYKRRKRESESGPPSPSYNKKSRPSPGKSPTMLSSPMSKDGEPTLVAITGAGNIANIARPIAVASGDNGETVHIVTTDAAGNILSGDAVVMTTIPQPCQMPGGRQPMGTVGTVLTMDVHEQKQWWQLEEMANSLVQQAQQLKSLIEQSKHQSLVNKEGALQNLRMQLEKEKHEALSAARIEAQMTLSRAVMEERAQKDIAVQHALAQARAEMQEKMDSVTVVSDDKVTTYNVTWGAQEQNNIEGFVDGEEEGDSDKDKD